jgi:tetratricopeptide (TPR) repeat protein
VSSSLKQFYLRQERYLEAERVCERWLSRQEGLLGPDSFYVLYILDELQEVYVLAGKYDIAEQIYHRMLNTAKKDQVQYQLLEASLLNNMSWLYKRLGRYAEAETLSQRASKIPYAA